MSELHDKMVSAAFLVGLETAKYKDPNQTPVDRLSRPHKIAALLLALGPEIATPIIKKLAPKEAQQLSTLMASTKSVNRESLMSILTEVYDITQHLSEIAFDPRQFAEKLMEKVDDEEEDGLSSLGRIRAQLLRRVPFSELLCAMDAEDLFAHLRGEHPQLVAVILAMILPSTGAKLLEKYSRTETADIAQRLATLGPPSSAMTEHLNHWVAETVKAHYSGAAEFQDVDVSTRSEESYVIDPVLELLSAGSPKLESDMRAALEEVNPTLAEKIRKEMFDFDDFLLIRNIELQKIIAAVPTETLTIALKKSPEKIKSKFFENMSVRQRAQVEFQIENLPQLTVGEITTRQREVVLVARGLQQSKEVTLERITTDSAA